MMIDKSWAGKITGTNVGNVYLELEGGPDNLTGEVRLNEHGVGIAIYTITGDFSNSTLNISGIPANQIEGYELGDFSASLQLNERGELVGRWETTIGSAGAVMLFSQTQSVRGKATEISGVPTFHSASHSFNSMFLDKKAIKKIGTSLQTSFPDSEVIITVVNETEKRCFLRDFEEINFDFEKANNIILFAQGAEANGVTKSARLDFGQAVNVATFQGSDESWVLGRLTVLRRELKKYERAFPNTFRRFGVGLNQIIIFGGLVFMPSLRNFAERSLFMVGILVVIFTLNYMSKKILPHAVLYMGEKPVGVFQRYVPSIISWTMTIVGTLLAVALGNALAKFGVPYLELK